MIAAPPPGPTPGSTPEPFELLALRYATHGGRKASDNYVGGDLHEGSDDLDYFVWVARRSDRLVVIDTGFGATAAAARGRTLLAEPADLLRRLGIDPAQVEEVVLTHLHYDHAGTLRDFPRARFHLQDREAAFATGRCMCHPVLRAAYDVEDTVALVRSVYAGRVCFHDGDSRLADGLWLHHIGGHTAGLQVVRVWTRRGWVVLASDAAHLYGNMERALPFPIVHDVERMLEGHRRLHALADSPAHIIPGHDPLVMQRYPALTPEATGILRLDVAPRPE